MPSPEVDGGRRRVPLSLVAAGDCHGVKAGSKVTGMNNDSEAHTVTSDTGGAFEIKVAPGKSATFTAPNKPGTDAYHYSYHSQVHGTLEVS